MNNFVTFHICITLKQENPRTKHFQKEVFKHKATAIFSKGRLLLGRVWLCSERTTFGGFKKLESEELSIWSHVVRKIV